MRDGDVRHQYHYYVLEQLEHLQSHCCRNPRLGHDSPPVANCFPRGTIRYGQTMRDGAGGSTYYLLQGRTMKPF
jgi:hypothetical protein